MVSCVDELLSRVERLLSLCASSMVGSEGRYVRVRVKWLEKLAEPVMGDVDASTGLIDVNLCAIGSLYDLVKTLAHEAAHVLQRSEYNSFYSSYERYAYAYNPFEAQANVVAENYADDNSGELEELLGPVMDILREVACRTWRSGKGFTYAQADIGLLCRRALDHIITHWDRLIKACSSLPPLSSYYEHYAGPMRRRSPMASLIIRLGRRGRERSIPGEDRPAATVAPGVDDIVRTLREQLRVALDGCSTTYCVLMKLDSFVDKVVSVSNDFGYESKEIIERVLSDETIIRLIRSSRFSIGEAEYLVYRTVYFPELRRKAPWILGLLEDALAKGRQPAPPSGPAGRAGVQQDEELESIIDKLARKLFLRNLKRSKE